MTRRPTSGLTALLLALVLLPLVPATSRAADSPVPPAGSPAARSATLTFHFWSGARATYHVTKSGGTVTGSLA
ncbi:hypothetical protein [Streptomyces sp. MB09-02B]|uniref:hypothetical protein n=1 Tax=Streptomyces sp. MB09-02B TaxID=3028667 RepID=UPI0029A1FE1F|nr:hypothetical protein [Streptomyces sp. MB09-02B]MDX3642154.1 hypothetical protein [Streptomyces sp. MB09-02B]